MPDIICVTGATGFIASWIIAAALKLNYRVRGTVRSKNNDKTKGLMKALTALVPEAVGQLELVEADLNSSKGWAEAVAGCTYVLHVASPFPMHTPKDPENELYKPAREGTLHVLRAVSETPAAQRPKRVVVTSSMAAVGFGHPPEVYKAHHLFEEKDWTNPDPSAPTPVSAYVRSKRYAEKAAWDFHAALPADKTFELAVVNPSGVYGPVMFAEQDSTSVNILGVILKREMPMVPSLEMNIVDIRDVVQAHLRAMVSPAAAGRRVFVATVVITLLETARVVDAEFRSLGYNAPTTAMPSALLWVGSFFDAQAATAYEYSKTASPRLNNSFAKELGVTLHDSPADVKDMLLASAYSLVKLGHVPDKSRGAIAGKPIPGPYAVTDFIEGLSAVA